MFCSAAYSKSLNIPPVEKTVVIFSKQVADVQTLSSNAKTSSGLHIDIRNSENSGILFFTLNENYTNGTIHIIFEDGDIETYEVYSDPSAPNKLDLRTGPAGSNTNVRVDAAMSYVETPTYSIPTKSSKEVNNLVYLLNNLENANKVWLRYEKPLPEGLKANVSRVLNYNNNLLYEVELRNETLEHINIEAAMLADYLTDAVAIAGMDQYGAYLMKPNEVNFVYISKRMQ